MLAEDELTLNSQLQPHRLAKAFKRDGRIHIKNVLPIEQAKQIRRCLREDVNWNLVTNNNGKHLDLDAAAMEKMGEAEKLRFASIVHAQARKNFQYLYKNYPIYDVYHSGRAPGHFLNRVFEFLNSAAFLGFVRTVTGEHNIGFADAQATLYEPGHFLTAHDDGVNGKNRYCAYVLNLTDGWNADWGGVTQFFDENGHVDEAFAPRFNALNIFRVPQPHSVSYVCPFAGEQRLSITGWLRGGADPQRRGGDRQNQSVAA